MPLTMSEFLALKRWIDTRVDYPRDPRACEEAESDAARTLMSSDEYQYYLLACENSK